jgi:hypothetical protein
MAHVVLLQALGRVAEAKEAMRDARKGVSGELELWIGWARGSVMSETMFQSFSQHFTDAWNATPEDASQ